MKKINVNCNICGSDNYEVLFPEGKAQIHRIVKCKNCDLMYANPQTTNQTGGKVGLDTSDESIITEEEIDKHVTKILHIKNLICNTASHPNSPL